MHDALASKRLLHIDAGAAPAYTVPTRPVQMESGFNTTAVGRVALALPIFSRCQLLRAHLARSQNQTIAATTRGVRPDILAQIHLIRLEHRQLEQTPLLSLKHRRRTSRAGPQSPKKSQSQCAARGLRIPSASHTPHRAACHQTTASLSRSKYPSPHPLRAIIGRALIPSVE
ncbi:hypothetical protein IQ06DRAFT_21580 [Phaeosphaeriaceae sp. SRC1lsM3a]|nr:hypothetical protein IQ06DRAFT_21580 [Stagonospora sp. SRC1lsM3a]